MNVDDYLIDQAGLNFEALFAQWQELLPDRCSVWLINKFGNMILVLDDGSVSCLDPGAGEVRRIAESQDEFCQFLDKDDNASDWLMISLVDALVASGMTLGKNECYGFRNLPPLLGGEYSVANSKPCSIYVHYSLLGQIAAHSRKHPGVYPSQLKIVK